MTKRIDSLRLFKIICYHWGIEMNDHSLTRSELSDAVVREVGLSRQESLQLVEDVLDHVAGALVDGETVKISSFGTFSCKEKKERTGRNPKTGVEAAIVARRVVTFRPSQKMKEFVNKGNQSN